MSSLFNKTTGLSLASVLGNSVATTNVYNNTTTTNTTTITSNIIVGTKAIVKGVLGTILWSRWGSADYGPSNSNSPYNYSSTHDGDSIAAVGGASDSGSNKMSGDSTMILAENSTFTHSDDADSGTSTQDVVLHKFLLPQQTLLDPPRKITSVTMDPLGNYCSVVDTLGRVMLIDLSTKQIVRMWKGLRDAKCYWIINPEETFLVIYARQRSLVEIWKMMHGPRVYKMEVSSSDFRIFQCSPTNTTITNCYTMQSGIIAPLNVPSQKDTILMNNSTCGPDVLINSASTSDKYALMRRSPVLHLQLLNQLLSEESSVPPTPESVYNAILQFTSTLDLSNALDLIASSSYLEEGLLLTGDEHELFYSRVVHLCQEKLALAEEQHNFLQQHADLLRRNIQFHTQVIEAYDLIRNFELDTFGDEEEEEDGEETEDGEIVGAPRTPWAEEAMSWIETYEEVTGGPLLGINDNSSKFLKFSSFFKACHMQSSSSSDVYYKAGTADRSIISIELCDSSKDRIVILSHVFSPLLKDIFVFKTVNLVFNSLGLNRNFPLLEQYFGEWFLSLPALEASEASLYDMWCPILRWLQDMIAAAYDLEYEGNSSEKHNMLPHLQTLCSEASDLPRAFLLAVVCREAVFIASKQREAKTYGKVSSKAAVQPWDRLLRKLRLCLLVSIRLQGELLDPLPITVSNVEAGNIFSVFQWIARDELTLSHKQDELDNVENACRSSRLKLHPSLPESDTASKWKILQRACGVRNKLNGERASLLFFPEKTDQPGPLLLYLSHFNKPIELAAHRALLLGEKWGKTPKSLHLIKDAVSALRVLEGNQTKYNNISCAVRLEIWQTRIRPIYRALFFGFEEVPELSEDIMWPLVHDSGWLRGLTKVAAEVLSLIERTPKILEQQDTVEVEMNDDVEEEDSDVDAPWPTVQDDIVLRSLVQRTKPVNMDSLGIHKGIICAAHLTDDINSLVLCAPSFGDVFLSSSLFSQRFESYCRTEEQISFLIKAVYKKAREFNGPLFDRFDLHEIENLGKAWGFTESRIRSEFILAIYLYGKDAMATDLLTDLSSSDEVEHFVSEALCIASIRIHATLKILKQVKQFRPILSMLDAETCRWVKDQTDYGLVKFQAYGFNADSFPSLSATHELVLKLLRMSSGAKDKTLVEKTHALSLLTATLLKAIQDGQDAV